MKENVIIIAEAGVNHNGDINIAKKLIDAAAAANVDFVKFQTFKADKLVTKNAKRSQYQEQNTNNKDSQFEMLKKLEMSHEMHQDLIKYCESKNVKFLSTAFDLESLDYLRKLNLGIAKIPSGEITNLPYLRKIAKYFPKVILSTGMSSLEEVKNAIKVLLKNGVKLENLTILHCNTEYPTHMSDVNLTAMLHIKKIFRVNVGYSDHTLGIEVPIAAVALGAKVIEKHFTLNNDLPGPDHKASLVPHQLKAMVTAIRNIEEAIAGSGIKEPSSSELKNKKFARKSIVASKPILKGQNFTDENITVKRPGHGLSPMKWDEVLKKKADRNYDINEMIK
jgi:N,N'-diacetyllegionaminate synthase